MSMPKYAENIKALRKARGWTQARLGMELGYSPDVIGRWERGDIAPSVNALIAISRVFSVSIDYIIGNKGKNNQNLRK